MFNNNYAQINNLTNLTIYINTTDQRTNHYIKKFCYEQKKRKKMFKLLLFKYFLCFSIIPVINSVI